MSVLVQRYFTEKEGSQTESEIDILKRELASLKTTLEKQFKV